MLLFLIKHTAWINLSFFSHFRPDDELVDVVIKRNPAYYEDKMKAPPGFGQWPAEANGYAIGIHPFIDGAERVQ